MAICAPLGASFADFSVLKDICPPPGLEKEAHFGLAPPPGLEFCRVPLPPCQISVAASLFQDPLLLAFQDYVQQRNACAQEAQPKHACLKAKVQSKSTAKNAARKVKKITEPLQPPGTFECGLPCVNATAPLMPPGVFKIERVPSSHSLASTAASANEKTEELSPKVSQPIEKSVVEEFVPVREAAHKVSQSIEKSSVEEFVPVRDLRVQHLGHEHVKVTWPVHAGKLRGKDKQIISPSFELLPGLSFKLMLKPKCIGDKKGQASFQKARGWGSVELKLMDGTELAPKLRFGISIGGGSTHGPIEHDFSNNTVGDLTTNGSFFDFTSAVDASSSNFLVSVELLPNGAQLASHEDPAV